MASPAAALLVIHRRPHRRHLLFAGVLGIVCAAGSTLLARMLMTEPSWLVSSAVGLSLGLILVAQVWSGSTVRIDADRTLVYRLRGLDVIAIPLSAIASFTPICTGALVGVGVVCPSPALTFLSRKGPTRRHVDTWQHELGVALVLEHLTPADCATLEDLLSKR